MNMGADAGKTRRMVSGKRDIHMQAESTVDNGYSPVSIGLVDGP